ncbi:MAG TPA: hypothetical protein PK109_03510 [Candidatus Paceibacterota bacterium]|nr:hypothetical protein [Candidatus Paceibacterota bacterium]
MGANKHGVSPKKIRKSPPKTKKRLAAKAVMLAKKALSKKRS